MKNKILPIFCAISVIAFAICLKLCVVKVISKTTNSRYILNGATTQKSMRNDHKVDNLNDEKSENEFSKYNLGVSAFDTDVKFWGKVVDQDGRPIEDAAIKAYITTLRMVKTENGYREFSVLETRSKNDGSFIFSDVKGFSLTIASLGKEGYVLPSAFQAGTRWESDGKYYYQYKSIDDQQRVFRPNPNVPETFHLWKLHKPEPLIIWGIWAGTNGPEFTLGALPRPFSMAAKPGGTDPSEYGYGPDINVSVVEVGSPQSPQWEIIISAVDSDGGVAKADSDDVFLFAAPLAGYDRTIRFRYDPKGTDLSHDEDGVPVRFYVRSKGGRWHAAVDSVFFAPDTEGKVLTKWRKWLNPSGSRNLEHDGAHPLPSPSLAKTQ